MLGVNYFLRKRDGFVISTNPECADLDVILGFLGKTTWWPDLNRDSLQRALRNSLCFSLLEIDRQIGVARVISDYTTYAYLCDVYIEEKRRGRGLGSWLVNCILEHPDLKDLKRIALITHDAQAFYLGLGFHFEPDPSHYMERHQ